MYYVSRLVLLRPPTFCMEPESVFSLGHREMNGTATPLRPRKVLRTLLTAPSEKLPLKPFPRALWHVGFLPETFASNGCLSK